MIKDFKLWLDGCNDEQKMKAMNIFRECDYFMEKSIKNRKYKDMKGIIVQKDWINWTVYCTNKPFEFDEIEVDNITLDDLHFLYKYNKLPKNN